MQIKKSFYLYFLSVLVLKKKNKKHFTVCVFYKYFTFWHLTAKELSKYRLESVDAVMKIHLFQSS